MKNLPFKKIAKNQFKLISESTFNTSLNRDDIGEIKIEVEYDFNPASRGGRERGTGLQLEPDTDASVDVLSATDIRTGAEIKLTPEEVKQVTIEIGEKLASDQDSYHPDDDDEGPARRSRFTSF